LASNGPKRNGPRIPRFLPPDPRVSQPYLLTPKMALRVAIIGAVALVAFGVLFLRLWSLQVLAATKYRSQAQNNQIRNVAFAAPRGPILDSQGRRLVVNTVSKAVEVWPADLPADAVARNGEIWQLAKVLGKRPAEIEATIRAHRNDGPIATTPVTLQVGISPDQEAYIEEHATQFNGVKIANTFLRYYNSEGLLAQTLGYVGRINPEQWAKLRHSRLGYLPDDRIGQAGIEAGYDQYLHGFPGQVQVTVDSTGRRIGQPAQTRAATPGKAVRLTIDSVLQRAAEKAHELRRSELDTEHLLYALADTDVCAALLKELKLSPQDLKSYIDEHAHTGTAAADASLDLPPLTSVITPITTKTRTMPETAKRIGSTSRRRSVGACAVFERRCGAWTGRLGGGGVRDFFAKARPR